ncbi:MAG TPA: rhomboid family intramembrane serine protease [Polyangiaceae bacterium]|nr:rhomboid family intramembrane serine protease [Polyangiaceae bacterium]
MQDSDSQPVTRTLLSLNIAMFVVETALTGRVVDLPSRPALELGASYAFATVGESRWETLLTACFLHAGVVHLAFNMLALWLAGPEVERAVGSARMAPMYLVAGAFGNLLGVEYNWLTRSDVFSVGASGAISGVLSAALVVGLRTEGRRSPLAGEMALWLGFVLVFGLASSLRGGRIDNAAHLGGALAGAVIASGWKLQRVYSRGASAVILAVSGGTLVACIALVAIRDRTNPFAGMLLPDRHEFTLQALADGRCGDAQRGLVAVEHLRANMAKVELRSFVEGTCGHVGLSPMPE